MRRTNIYLSQAEQVALDARAVAEGRTRSEVVRTILDNELHLAEDTAADSLLADLAVELAANARRLSASDPDLRID